MNKPSLDKMQELLMLIRDLVDRRSGDMEVDDVLWTLEFALAGYIIDTVDDVDVFKALSFAINRVSGVVLEYMKQKTEEQNA